MKKQVKKQTENGIAKEVKKLLSQQTGVILEAVDERFDKLEKRMDKMEKSMDELRNTLDRFLKRLTDFSDEFKIVKARLKKVERIIEEKLGVTVDLWT